MEQNEQNEQLNPLFNPAYTPTDDFATYKNYTSARLSGSEPEEKSPKGTGQNGAPIPKYKQIVLAYNYGKNGTPAYDSFYLEGPTLKSPGGIVTKDGPSGRPESSIMVRFDKYDPEQALFLSVLDDIHMTCAKMIEHYKGKLKCPKFCAVGCEDIFKPLYYTPINTETGEKDEGKAPSMFLKLFTRGAGTKYEEKTLFTDLDEKPVSWDKLVSAEVSFKPLIVVQRIFCGSKFSLKAELVSAVLTDTPKRKGWSTRQTSTIKKLNDESPELREKIRAGLQKMDESDTEVEAKNNAQNTNNAVMSQSTSSNEQGYGMLSSMTMTGEAFSAVREGLPPIPSLSGLKNYIN